MSKPNIPQAHAAEHFSAAQRSLFQPAPFDLIRIGSRRWFLQTGLAGIAGLSLPELLRRRAQAAPKSGGSRKAVILFGFPADRASSTSGIPSPTRPSRCGGRSIPSPQKSPACGFASTFRCRPASFTSWPSFGRSTAVTATTITVPSCSRAIRRRLKTSSRVSPVRWRGDIPPWDRLPPGFAAQTIATCRRLLEWEIRRSPYGMPISGVRAIWAPPTIRFAKRT